MKIVLLITVIESLIVASLLVLWRVRRAYSKIPAPAISGSAIAASDNLITTPALRVAGDSRWDFISGWKVEPQADDRRPVLGTIAYSDASPSARRSTARRRHQEMYKDWSKTRHE